MFKAGLKVTRMVDESIRVKDSELVHRNLIVVGSASPIRGDIALRDGFKKTRSYC